MNDLHKRLAKLEVATTPPAIPHQTHRFLMEGPAGLPPEDAVAFLRSNGHEVRDEDLNIIRVVTDAENGQPIDLLLRDRTAEVRQG
ncbi:hypothetical protein MKK70_07995 [Methylobacterium sp. E-041]|uniref:hypothetical protein n=1 Tax=unclassified Methylobacterium TaxID=2615210 RepID=UPI001FBBA90F|nr:MULTISPECIES: hypothetical protein [unclassified Methylobacterium]MCJ2041658.1 hypothetical protein [Methylobacterium sp. J-059]MCJ2105325.1 hypothetical protein [Methylobacterium sp. E-041]